MAYLDILAINEKKKIITKSILRMDQIRMLIEDTIERFHIEKLWFSDSINKTSLHLILSALGQIRAFFIMHTQCVAAQDI